MAPGGCGHTPGMLRVDRWRLWASSGRGADPRDIFVVWGTKEVPREVSVSPSLDVFRSKLKTAQSNLV